MRPFTFLRRAPATALIGLWLCACHPNAAAARDDRLPVTELEVAFPDDGAGELRFALDCPLDVGAKVTTLRWELSLAGNRFAAGLEGEPQVTASGDRRVRVAVRAPLRYRHVRFEAGYSFVEVALTGELVVNKRGAELTVPFGGHREVLARGVPALEDERE